MKQPTTLTLLALLWLSAAAMAGDHSDEDHTSANSTRNGRPVAQSKTNHNLVKDVLAARNAFEDWMLELGAARTVGVVNGQASGQIEGNILSISGSFEGKTREVQQGRHYAVEILNGNRFEGMKKFFESSNYKQALKNGAADVLDTFKQSTKPVASVKSEQAKLQKMLKSLRSSLLLAERELRRNTLTDQERADIEETLQWARETSIKVTFHHWSDEVKGRLSWAHVGLIGKQRAMIGSDTMGYRPIYTVFSGLGAEKRRQDITPFETKITTIEEFLY